MPFKTTLRAEIIRGKIIEGRQVWRLLEPLVHVDRTGKIRVVPPDFETDFASVPRAPFAYWLCGDTAHEAATLHDHALKHEAAAVADALFLEVLKETPEMPAWRRNVMHLGVRIGTLLRRERAEVAVP